MNEAQRLEALRGYAIMDTPPESGFDDITALAAEICGTPIALITLIDESRQWFKSKLGIDLHETPREHAFCAHALHGVELLYVPDAREDNRFADNPFVCGEAAIRFYAGSPLITPRGETLGTLCVIDRVPRNLNERQKNALGVLSRHVMTEMQLRRQIREQQRTERALRESDREQRALAIQLEHQRARLAEAQTVAKVGSFEVDLVTLKAIWSEETYRIFGTSPDKYQPSHPTFLEFVHPDDREWAGAAFSQATSQHGQHILEFRLLLPDGQIKHVEERWQVFFNDANQPIRAIGTCQDISERKAAEAAKRELAGRLTATLESLTEGFFTVDTFWRFTYVNREAEIAFKLTQDDLIGHHMWERFPEARGSLSHMEYERAMREQVAVQFETYYPPLGIWFSVRAYPSPDSLAVYFRDVTEARKAREELRTSEERFRLLAKATNDAVWDWNLVTHTMWRNEGYEKLFGYPRSEVRPDLDSWENRIHPDDRRAVVESLHRAIESGAESWSAEYRFLRRDGGHAHVLDRGHIMRDAAGAAVRMIGGMNDLTEQKKLEAQYLRAQRMESLGTLASGIAHDLNNLLAPITMGVDLLRQFTPNPRVVPVIDTIERSAKRGSSLVRQVLSFARGVEGSRIPIQVGHVIREVEGIVRNTFPKNITFITDHNRDVWLVMADATQINQVLLNLCVNARDAMPNGGRLTVSANNIEVDRQTAQRNQGLEPGRYVLVQVTDNGAGMTREVVDRIFEPFFTTKELGKGTGLGLSTVIGIVRSHGGIATVYSEPGKGSTFKIYLPARGDIELEVPAVSTAEKNPRGTGELIMVVDDEISILEMAKDTLETFGYKVITAEDGAQGIGLFAKHQRDVALVLTDMMMPVMDGPALIAALHRMDPKVRIIAASGLNANASVAKAATAGVKHFLDKPYSADTLLTLVRKALGGKATLEPSPAGR